MLIFVKISVLLWFIFWTLTRFTCSNKVKYCRGKTTLIYVGGGRPKNPWTRNFYRQGVSRCRSLFWYTLKYIHVIVELGFDPLNSWQISAYHKIFLKTFGSTVLFKYLLTSISPKHKKTSKMCIYAPLIHSIYLYTWYLFNSKVSIAWSLDKKTKGLALII